MTRDGDNKHINVSIVDAFDSDNLTMVLVVNIGNVADDAGRNGYVSSQ